MGGEALSVPHIRKAQSLFPALQIFNGYGPTEGTTFTCVYEIPTHLPDELPSVPIGRRYLQHARLSPRLASTTRADRRPR